MTPRLASTLPDWPALMSIDVACDYLDLSATSFRFMARMAGVRPVDCHGLALARWRRADLDRMIDSLCPRGGPSPPATEAEAQDDSPPDDPAMLAARALERVRRGLKR